MGAEQPEGCDSGPKGLCCPGRGLVSGTHSQRCTAVDRDLLQFTQALHGCSLTLAARLNSPWASRVEYLDLPCFLVDDLEHCLGFLSFSLLICKRAGSHTNLTG